MISNKVFTANVGRTIDLHHPDLTKLDNYKAPVRFPGGRLKMAGSTCLLFKSGKVVINGVKTEPDELEFAVTTGLYLQELKLSHCSGYMKIGKVKLDQLTAKIKGSIYEPELHPGLHFKIDNVSVIIYATGTVMFCGCRDDQHVYKIKCEILNRVFA
jgi:TATA-box binding protein (TBP) (component of TFIID and TFIIIB)